jgi:nitroreductase
MQYDRLTMPIGEAMFTQRSTRKLRPDPIPVEDLHLIMEAAVKAPNGGNHQVGRFLIVNDRAKIRKRGGPSAGTTTSGPNQKTSRSPTRTTAPRWASRRT